MSTDEKMEEGEKITDTRLGDADRQSNAAFGNMDSIMGIPVKVQVVLGSAQMQLSDLLKLGRGAIIPLDHRVGEPVDIVVNGRTVARGEVVVVKDDNSRFGVALTEIVGNDGPGQNAAVFQPKAS